MRAALIKLFEEPIPESYVAGRKVMEAVLGRALTDKPVFCFSSNPVLAALVKPGKSPCVWETKERLGLGYESVVRTAESAGQELLMDFVGKQVHTRYILSIYFKSQKLILFFCRECACLRWENRN